MCRSQIRSITTMALVLSAVFFSCNVLDCIWWMLNHTNNVNSAIFHCLKEFCETLSSSVNVLIFGLFGQKFRRTFFRLFCPCKKTKDYNQIPMKDKLTRKLTMETNCQETKIDTNCGFSVSQIKIFIFQAINVIIDQFSDTEITGKIFAISSLSNNN